MLGEGPLLEIAWLDHRPIFVFIYIINHPLIAGIIDKRNEN